MAQTKGTFETHDFDNFRLHVYHTNDALGDASYIVEGTQAVVTLEQPLFRENVAEYDAYLDTLGKPVEARIVRAQRFPARAVAVQATTRRSCPQGCPPSRRMRSTTA